MFMNEKQIHAESRKLIHDNERQMNLLPSNGISRKYFLDCTKENEEIKRRQWISSAKRSSMAQ